MPDRSSLSLSEITEVLTLARDSSIVNKGDEVILLEATNTPTFNYYKKNIRDGLPTRGEYKAIVSGKRNGQLQVYSGRDLLAFTGYDTSFELTYGLGADHLGDECTAQQFEESGVSIAWEESTSKGQQPSRIDPKAKAAAVNFAKKRYAEFAENYHQENNFLFWQSNAVLGPKSWPGIDSMCSATSNSSGVVGGKSQGNPLLRHQLITGVTIDTLELNVTRMMLLLKDAGQSAGAVKYICGCGNDVFLMLADLYLGTSLRAGKIDRMMASERAAAMGEKWGIGLDDDSFVIPGVGMIVREQSFAQIDIREPSAPVAWRKKMFFLPTKSLYLAGPRHATMIAHPMPHNQEVLKMSLKGKKCLVNERPNLLGLICLA